MAVATIKQRRANSQDTALPTWVAPAYNAMSPGWKICRDVYGGTPNMRDPANLDTYLPRGVAETTDERAARSLRAELFPMFKETVKGLVGLALRKDPKLGSDVPQSIVKLAENIDGAGTALPVFARRLFTEALSVGHVGLLVDVPKVSTSKPLTLRQERELGLRVYWVIVKPEQIVNWRTKVINGSVVLTLLVIEEVVDEEDGDFGTVSVTRFRVFRRDDLTGLVHYEVWTQEDEGSDPERDSEGDLPLTRIPFTVCYGGERVAPLQSIPPLLDLAYTSIAHFQVLSDHRSAIHAASNPILVTKGRTGVPTITPDPNAPAPPLPGVAGQSADFPAVPGVTPNAPPLVLGVQTGIDVGKEGDAKYIEHGGEAIGASRQELLDIETRGAAQGMAMLQRDTRAAQTAEAERLQRNEKDASLSNGVASLKDAIETGFAFTALLTGEASGGSYEPDTAFEDSVMTDERIQTLNTVVVANNLTRWTFWDLLIKGGILPDDFDKDAENQKLEAMDQLTLERMNPTAGGEGGKKTTAGGSTAGSDTGAGSGGGGE